MLIVNKVRWTQSDHIDSCETALVVLLINQPEFADPSCPKGADYTSAVCQHPFQK